MLTDWNLAGSAVRRTCAKLLNSAQAFYNNTEGTPVNLKARFYSIEFLRNQFPTKCFLSSGASIAGVESLCQWADLRYPFSNEIPIPVMNCRRKSVSFRSMDDDLH
jgi:hypothetical protein